MTHYPHLPRPFARAAAMAFSLAAAQGLHAQEGPMPFAGGPMRHDVLFMAASELDGERVVQGMPYCADAVHETVRTLADGNRIVHRQQSRQCRDGQGRTRQEVAMGTRKHVFLRDPVAQEAWLIEPDAKTATRLPLPPRRPPLIQGEDGGKPGWDRLREWSRDMREWGRDMGEWARERFRHFEPGRPAATAQSPQPPQPPQAPAPVPPMPEVPPLPVRIVIASPSAAELPPMPPVGALPPAVAFHARAAAPRGAGTVVSLPAETVEGVRAEGKRTTWTIEAGRIGNEKPIVVTREVWTSPELQLTLRSKDSDPLAGEDSYRLQNLVRGEPEAALLRVPEDFRRIQPAPRRP